MEDGRSGRLARVRALWPPTPYQEHGPVVVLFKLVDQFQVQEGERPKLRGQDATQLIVFKISAIGGWSERQIRGQASGLSLSAAALPALSLYPAAVRGVEPRCCGSHLIQHGERAELRGQAATQTVFFKLPARRAPERMEARVEGSLGGTQEPRAD